MTKLRVISDIHGDYKHFLSLINDEIGNESYCLQIGDFGFDYDCLKDVNSEKVKICLGNHENYDVVFNYPHVLGDFGNVELGPFEFFYVRGGFSVDRGPRIDSELVTGIKSWWKQEELTYRQSMLALEEYEIVKPDVMISHDICSSIANFIGNPLILKMFGHESNFVSKTQDLLQQMFEIHSPKLWIFGHYHKNFNIQYKGTNFICINEKEYIDFKENWVRI